MTCVDWNKINEFLIASGDSDGNWKIFDTRFIATDKPRETKTEKLESSISSVQWSPNVENIVGVSTAFKILLYKKNKVYFTHEGHRYSVDDWRWNGCSSQCDEIASVASDIEGGGTLQVWRPAGLDLYKLSVVNLEEYLDEQTDESEEE